MKNNLLLPRGFQKIGWALLLLTVPLGLFLWQCDFSPEQSVPALDGWSPALNNIALVGILAGLLLVACSRERVEDEMIPASASTRCSRPSTSTSRSSSSLHSRSTDSHSST